MLQPIRDLVLVSMIKEEERTASGLIIKPTTVEEKIVSGKVLSVGRGHMITDGTFVPLEVSVGDLVIFNKNMTIEVKNDGETCFLVREENILAINK